MTSVHQHREGAEDSSRRLAQEWPACEEVPSDAIARIDVEGVIRSWNEAAEALLLYGRQDVVGRPLVAVLPHLSALVQTAREQPDREPCTCEVPRRDGTPLQCEVRVIAQQPAQEPGHLLLIRDRTAAHRREAELRQVYDRVRGIVEHAVEGVFQTTPEGRFLSANPALAHILGYGSAEELIASVTDLGLQLYVHPEQRLALRQVLDSQGLIRGFEAEFYRKDGRRIWVSLSGRTVRNHDGSPRYYEGMLEDITERKRHAERLAQINECFLRFGNNPNENINRLTALCGSLLGGLKAEYCILDQGRLISVARWPGRPPFCPVGPAEQPHHAEVLARGGEDVFYHPLDDQGVEGGPPGDASSRLAFVARAVRRHDRQVGSLAVVRIGLGYPSESDRRLIGIIASAIGVEEERKHAQQALRDAYDETELILSSLPNGILIVDRRQVVLWGNPLAHQYLGGDQDALVGRSLHELLPEPEARRIRLAPPSGSLGAEAGYWRHDREFERDGAVYRYRCFPVAGYRGQQPQTGLVIWDVTEEKRLLDQLIQAEKLASLGTMVSGMAHEINNPSQAILGLAEIIKEEESAEKTREYAAEIAGYTQHIASVVRDFCFYARTTSRVGETDLDVDHCLVEAVRMVRRGPHFGKVDVATQFDGIPRLRARPNEIEQVFVNIISNAVQAMRGEGRLTLRTWRESDATYVAITDTGPGIPKRLLGRIFDPFFTTKQAGQGTGIGLSIAYRIVAKYHGRITVDSEEGVGTTFTIHFPIGSEPKEV